MRNGFRVWDTDTHVRPTLETLEPYYDPGLRARLPELEKYKRAIKVAEGDRASRTVGHHEYEFPGYIAFRRRLGEAAPAADAPYRQPKKSMGAKPASAGAEDDNPAARIADMD